MKSRLLVLLAIPTLFAADYAAEGKLWWAHVQFLADDGLEGRNPGTPGFGKAVQYVGAQFDKLGLQPAGTSGYLQPIRFESRRVTEPTLELVRDGKTEALAVGQDATISSRGDVAPLVEAPMVFVG